MEPFGRREGTMRGTLFFVHGTGVRKEGWVTTWNRVRDYARANGVEGVDFVDCDWGLRFGVPLDLVPATLPPELQTKDAAAAPAPDEREIAAAAWALLLDDPLFELRLAGEGSVAGAGGAAGVVVGELRADQAAVAMLRSFAGTAGTLDLAGTDLAAEEIARAAGEVAASPELAAAARAAKSAADPDLLAAIARAVVARALAGHRADPPGAAPAALLDGARRDALAARLADALAPRATKGALTDWLKKKAVAFAASRATRALEDRRQGLMGMSTPAIGDILFYQRRGGEILADMARRLQGLAHPVVAVGHSLGGIMLVDLLSRADHPPVDLLVTAGSQSPMLYAIDSLEGLRRGAAAPAPFTPWLNIYNRQDFLSFCAARVFPGIAGIQDEEVDPGVPFPESHSAYWTCDRVYQLIREAWPGA
ncbi:MAG TPA: hypothetical protein VLC07_05775 [Solirubrobacterales bacterium]|nr:hypothetical protein [Solirubrobacterales bacterium]